MTHKRKIYSTAPLPFMGQKRRFIKHYKSALTQFPEAMNPFNGAQLEEMKVHVNHNAGYTDMMLYKNVSVAGDLDVTWESNVS